MLPPKNKDYTIHKCNRPTTKPYFNFWKYLYQLQRLSTRRHEMKLYYSLWHCREGEGGWTLHPKINEILVYISALWYINPECLTLFVYKFLKVFWESFQSQKCYRLCSDISWEAYSHWKWLTSPWFSRWQSATICRFSNPPMMQSSISSCIKKRWTTKRSVDEPQWLII